MEHAMTDKELIDGDLNGTLTDEQLVEYLIRIEKCHPSTARTIVYTDWDRAEKDRRKGISRI